MTEQQRLNCRTLLDVLRDLDEEQCFMNSYIITQGKGLPEPGDRAKPGCGTTACLAGWAAVAFAPISKEWDSTIAVPAEWAVEHGLYKMSPEDLGVTLLSSQDVVVSTADAGKELLGDEAAAYFQSIDGPEHQDMTHQEWMIAVLKGVLGEGRLMPVDERGDHDHPDMDWDSNHDEDPDDVE